MRDLRTKMDAFATDWSVARSAFTAAGLVAIDELPNRLDTKVMYETALAEVTTGSVYSVMSRFDDGRTRRVLIAHALHDPDEIAAQQAVVDGVARDGQAAADERQAEGKAKREASIKAALDGRST